MRPFLMNVNRSDGRPRTIIAPLGPVPVGSDGPSAADILIVFHDQTYILTVFHSY